MQCVNEKTPAPAVRKRPFWKRTNRGFVVSMVLLAAVIVYVVVSQLMLIPDKNDGGCPVCESRRLPCQAPRR